MPSLRTRVRFQNLVLETAEEAIAEATADLAVASEAVNEATSDLAALALGSLDLAAITIDGTRFVNNGGVLEPEA